MNYGFKCFIFHVSRLATIDIGVNWNLHGLIDDVRIWKKQLTVTEIRHWAFREVIILEPYLSNRWVFNEGYGSVSVDVVAGVTIAMGPLSPWPQPEYVLTTYKDVYTSLSVYNIYRRKTVTISVNIHNFCYENIYTRFNSYKATLGDVIFMAYYEECVFNAVVGNGVQNSMEILLGLSYYCRIDMKLTTWPLRELCASFGSRAFPYWSGNTCDNLCLSGIWNNNACRCNDGFWGTSCDSVCPYFNQLPCGGGGTCSLDLGQCTCPYNLDPQHDCQSCITGYTGKDCSTVVTSRPPSATHAVCSLFGFSHMSMFDGQTFDVPVAAEFLLLSVTDIDIYVRQQPCVGHNLFCVKQLWMRTATDNITIQTPLSEVDKYRFYQNDNPLTIATEHVLTDVTIKRENEKMLKVTFGSNVMTLHLEDHLISLELTLMNSDCSASSGFCGNCDGNVDNDLVTSSNVYIKHEDITVELIKTEVVSHWSIPVDYSTHFVYIVDGLVIPRVQHEAGFSLMLDGTGAFSTPLHNTFSNYGDGSIGFKFNALTQHGTLFTYTNGSSSFNIVLNGTLNIVIGDQIIYTDTTIDIHKWYHVGLTFNSTTNEIVLYIIVDGVVITTKTVVIDFHYSTIFTTGGSIHLGHYEDIIAQTLTGFRGQIEDVTTWNKPLTVDEVLYSATNLLSGGYPGLTSLWPLNEGSGYTTVDVVSGHTLILPAIDTYWWPSDLNIPGHYPVVISDEGLKTRAELECQHMVDKLSTVCSSLGPTMAAYYHTICVQDVTNSRNPNGYSWSMNAYVGYCEATVNPAVSAMDTLCDYRTVSYYLTMCSLYKCKFGSIDTQMDCICHNGYWKEDCSMECPGNNKTFEIY